MNDLKEALKPIEEMLKQLRENCPPSKPIEKPRLIGAGDLEDCGLISQSVVGGQPVLNVHFLESCQYNGCTPSDSGMHSITYIQEHTDFIQPWVRDEFNRWVRKTDENKEPVYEPITREYSTAKKCPYCGAINEKLLKLKSSGIGADCVDKHFKNYEFEAPQLKTKIDHFINGEIRGGILWGKPGNGKTHLLSAVARELVFRGKSVRYVSHQHLLETIKRSFDGNEIDPRLRWLDGKDYILFDELGFCPRTDWARQTTNELIHAAHAAGVKILFASNLSPDQLKSKLLDMRTSSRMGELVGQFVYNMKGADRRGGF